MTIGGSPVSTQTGPPQIKSDLVVDIFKLTSIWLKPFKSRTKTSRKNKEKSEKKNLCWIKVAESQ